MIWYFIIKYFILKNLWDIKTAGITATDEDIKEPYKNARIPKSGIIKSIAPILERDDKIPIIKS